MAEDFSLSAELNIQKIKVDAAKINESISKAKITNLKIKPVMTIADLRKALPVKTLGIRLKISNVPELKEQLKKALNIDDISSIFSAKQSRPAGSRAKSSGGGKKEVSSTSVKQAKDFTKAILEQGKTINKTEDDLAEFLKRLEQASNKGFKNGFFDQATKNVKALIAQLNTTGVLDRFAGKNGQALKNLTTALEFVFNKIQNLQNQRKKLGDLGVLSPKLNTEIDQVQSKLANLFNNVEISNASTIRSQVEAFLGPLSDSFRAAERDAEDFEKAIGDLTQRTLQLDKAGRGNSELANNLRQQSSSLQSSRGKGFGFSDAKSINSQLLEEERILNQVNKSAERAQISVEKVLSTKVNTDLNSTLAADIIGSPQQIESLANDALSRINKVLSKPNKNTPSNLGTVEGIKTDLNKDISKIENDTRNLNNILNRISSLKLQFDNEGLERSSAAVSQLKGEVVDLVRRGVDLETVGRQTEKGLIDVRTINERERALNRYETTLEKLKINLSAGDKAPDLLGNIDALDKAILKLRKLSDSGASPIELQKFIAETSASVRATDRLNQKVEKLKQKFFELEVSQNTTFKADVFNKFGQKFDDIVNRILSGSGSVQDKLNRLQAEFIKLKGIASVEAEGGLLGSFAKLSGLAAKRLLSFLIVARATFAVQDVFLSSVTAALELETQVVKLEQVFAKTASTEQILVERTNSARKSIFDLAQTFGVAVGEVAKASRILAQAGFIGQDLEKALRAIIKANLGPTFNDINQTAEASIAILNQFNREASDLESILGGINQVSALYAVESEGIAKAVRKAGGAFKSSGGNIEEFVGSFTILKKETREADEALATALRNISIRLQRTSTQNKVGNILGIDFRDQNNQFIGVVKSVGRIKEALDQLGIQSTDPRFARVVESLAGARQFARLIPLIENFDELTEIQGEFAKGAGSLDDDATRALAAIQNKIEQLKATFAELSQTVLTSQLFKTLLDFFLSATKAANSFIQAIDGISYAMVGLASVGIPAILSRGLFSTFLAESGSVSSTPLFGQFLRRNSGGPVPGRGPDADTVPAMLTRGEYVFSRKAVDTIGAGSLDNIHKKARRGFKGFNKGGRVGFNTGGLLGGNKLALAGIGLTGITTLMSNSDEAALKLGDFTTALLLATAATKLSAISFKNIGDNLGKFLRPKINPLERVGTRPTGARILNQIRPKNSGSTSLLNKALPKVSKGLLNLGKIIGRFGPAGLAAVTAFNFLKEAALSNTKEQLAQAKTAREVNAAADSLEFAESASELFGILPALGSMFSTLGSYTSELGGNIVSAADNVSKFVGIDFGAVADSLSSLVGTDRGKRATRNLNLSRVEGSEFADNLKSGNREQAAKELEDFIPAMTSAIVDGSLEAGETYKSFVRSNPDLKTTAEKFAKDISAAVEAGVPLEDLKKNIDPKKFKEFTQLFEAIGVDLKLEKISKAVVAIDQLSLLFSAMKAITENAANDLTRLEGSLGKFSENFESIANQGTGFSIPDQAFDLLGKGVDPRSKEVNRLVGQLGAGEAQAVNLEFGIKSLSNQLNEKIIENGSRIKFDPNKNDPGGAITDVLLQGLEGLNVSQDIKALYSKFLNANESDLGSGVNVDAGQSSINSDKIIELNKKFANQFGGAIENLKRRAAIDQQFTDKYKAILDKRITLEEQARGSVSKLINIRKEQIEFNNKLNRSDGSSSQNLRQSRSFDNANLRNILQNTGIKTPSVANLKRAFDASVGRSNAIRGGGATNRSKTIGLTRENQIQTQINNAFDALANGGETLRASFEGFEKVLEETRKTNEKFRNSLLGSDDELIKTVKGIDAFNKIVNSGNQIQATNTLLGLSEQERQGVKGFIGDDTGLKAQFDRAIGSGAVGSIAANSPEAQNVKSQLALRERATKAQLEITNSQISAMDGLAKALTQGEKSAIQNMQTQVNSLSIVANQVNNAIANMPTEVVHNHNIPDVNVRIFGGDNLANLPKEFKTMVSNQITSQIQKFEAAQKKKNKGLN